MRKEDAIFLAQLCKREAAEARAKAASEEAARRKEAASRKSIAEGRALQEGLLKTALGEQVLTVLGRVTIAMPGMALEYLSYELLPLIFVDNLTFGEYRWYIDRRFKFMPRDIQRSYRAISGKTLRKIYEHLLTLHSEAAKYPERFPGWAAIRGEHSIPLSKKVKVVKTWLGEGGVVWTTK